MVTYRLHSLIIKARIYNILNNTILNEMGMMSFLEVFPQVLASGMQTLLVQVVLTIIYGDCWLCR